MTNRVSNPIKPTILGSFLIPFLLLNAGCSSSSHPSSQASSPLSTMRPETAISSQNNLPGDPQIKELEKNWSSEAAGPNCPSDLLPLSNLPGLVKNNRQGYDFEYQGAQYSTWLSIEQTDNTPEFIMDPRNNVSNTRTDTYFLYVAMNFSRTTPEGTELEKEYLYVVGEFEIADQDMPDMKWLLTSPKLDALLQSLQAAKASRESGLRNSANASELFRHDHFHTVCVGAKFPFAAFRYSLPRIPITQATV